MCGEHLAEDTYQQLSESVSALKAFALKGLCDTKNALSLNVAIYDVV